MEITNVTKRTIVARDAYHARTFAEKTKGLLGRDTPQALVMRTRWGIHTAGMRFPIDCAVLDRDLTVRAVREVLPPGDLFLWNPRFGIVIELPAGTLAETRTEIGDRIATSEAV